MTSLPWWGWAISILILFAVVVGCSSTAEFRPKKRYRVAAWRGETGDPVRDYIYFSVNKRIPEIIEDTETGDFRRV